MTTSFDALRATVEVTQIVPISQLVVSPFNMRKQIDLDTPEARDFFRDVATRGIQEPLRVRPTPRPPGSSGAPQFEVIEGQLRLLAAKAAGAVRVPVVIRNVDDAEAARMSFAGNVHRTSPTLLDHANLVRMYLDMRDPTGKLMFPIPKDLAKYLNVNPSRLAAWIAVGNLPENARRYATQGKLKLKAVEALAQGLDEDEQRLAADAIVEADLSSDEQAEAVREVKRDKSITRRADRGTAMRERVRKPKSPDSRTRVNARDLVALRSELKRINRPDLIKSVDALGKNDHAQYQSLMDVVREHDEATARAEREAREPKRAPNLDAVDAASGTAAAPDAAFEAFLKSVTLISVVISRPDGLDDLEYGVDPDSDLGREILREAQQLAKANAHTASLASLPITEPAAAPADGETHATREDQGL